MSFEAPVGGTVHTGGGEGRETQLVLAGGDVLGHLLQVGEVLDVIGRVAGLLQKGLVVDDAVSLQHITDAGHLVPVHQGEIIAGQLPGHLGAGKVIAVVLPGRQAHRAVHLEQSGGIGLSHLGLQGSLIVAGGGGQHGNLHTGLLRVELCQFLPLGIGLRLEIHEIDLAAGRRVAVSGRSRTAGIGSISTAAAQNGQRQGCCKAERKELSFHFQ